MTRENTGRMVPLAAGGRRTAGPGARLWAVGATRRVPAAAGTPTARILPSQARARSPCPPGPGSAGTTAGRPPRARARAATPDPAPAPAVCPSHPSPVSVAMSAPTGDRARQGANDTSTPPRPVRGHQPVNTGPEASSARDGPRDRQKQDQWQGRHGAVVHRAGSTFASWFVWDRLQGQALLVFLGTI
jgi:hypothetical protein